MSPLVLDASVALAWLLGEEGRSGAEEALARLRDGDAMVPLLWHLEIRNGLLVAMRRGRLAGASWRARRPADPGPDRHPDLEPPSPGARGIAVSLLPTRSYSGELAERPGARLQRRQTALPGAADSDEA